MRSEWNWADLKAEEYLAGSGFHYDDDDRVNLAVCLEDASRHGFTWRVVGNILGVIGILSLLVLFVVVGIKEQETQQLRLKVLIEAVEENCLCRHQPGLDETQVPAKKQDDRHGEGGSQEMAPSF